MMKNKIQYSGHMATLLFDLFCNIESLTKVHSVL